MNICILSTFNHPLLSLFLNKYKFNEFKIKILIDSFDDKEILSTFNYRTRNSFNLKTIHNIKNKYPYYFFENHNNNDVINFIKHQNTDLIINLGTPRILKNKILKSSKIGVLNCHPGILPFYRGCNCVEWALLNKDIIGNTCHLMTEKIDEGPIIYKKYLKYSNRDNYYEIRARIYDHH